MAVASGLGMKVRRDSSRDLSEKQQIASHKRLVLKETGKKNFGESLKMLKVV